ncbi:hypothetical protein [Halobellus sp. GM3]|uniref:hypothetical protein n=1 Tax=Halobellus sp. GM3 TaxID=3458410 RepID=UPI00403D7FA1
MYVETPRPLVLAVLFALLIGYGGLWLTDLPPALFVVIVAAAGIVASLLIRKSLTMDE